MDILVLEFVLRVVNDNKYTGSDGCVVDRSDVVSIKRLTKTIIHMVSLWGI